MNCWLALGIEPTDNKRDIKKAYAKQLKANNPEDAPERFQQLREAYDQALMQLENGITVSFNPGPDNSSVSYSQTDILTSYSPQPQIAYNVQAPAAKKEDIFNEQISAVQETIAELLSILDTDSDQAIEYLKNKLSENYYQALDVRYELEGGLITELVKKQLYNQAFTQYLEQEFNWEIDLYHSHEIVTNHFPKNSDYRRFFTVYSNICVNEKIKAIATENAKTFFSENEFQRFLAFREVLFNPLDFEEFKDFCRQGEYQQVILDTYRFLASRRFNNHRVSSLPFMKLIVLFDQGYFNPATVHRKPTQQPVKPPEQEKSSPLIAIFVVLILIVGVFAVINSANNAKPIKSTENVEKMLAEIVANRQPNKSPIINQIINKNNAENGDQYTQYSLAIDLLYPKDPDTKNIQEGLDWLKKSAAQDYSEAKRALGLMYLYGEYVPQDTVTGLNYLNDAIRSGNAKAATQLAVEYLNGKALETDYREAFLLFQSSSDNQPLSKLWLSELYAKGIGVEKDMTQAKSLFDSTILDASDSVINQFAWELSIISNMEVANGALAVHLMEQLLSKPNNTSWKLLNTLSAAYAQKGDFDKAIETETQALDLLPKNSSDLQHDLILKRLKSYQNKQVYTERLNSIP